MLIFGIGSPRLSVSSKTEIASENGWRFYFMGLNGSLICRRDEVYKGGVLVFHALRLKVGEEVFFKILRTYLARYQGGSAGTDELIGLAEEISGQDLQEFFRLLAVGQQATRDA